jgi:hypothetical protein
MLSSPRAHVLSGCSQDYDRHKSIAIFSYAGIRLSTRRNAVAVAVSQLRSD